MRSFNQLMWEIKNRFTIHDPLKKNPFILAALHGEELFGNPKGITTMSRINSQIPNTPSNTPIYRHVWGIRMRCQTCHRVHYQHFFVKGEGQSVADRVMLPLVYLGLKEVFITINPFTKAPSTRFIGQEVHDGNIVTYGNLGDF